MYLFLSPAVRHPRMVGPQGSGRVVPNGWWLGVGCRPEQVGIPEASTLKVREPFGRGSFSTNKRTFVLHHACVFLGLLCFGLVRPGRERQCQNASFSRQAPN